MKKSSVISNNTDINYNEIAREIFNEQNRLRRNPKSYIDKLKYAKDFFNGKIFSLPTEVQIETYEGVKGIENAIKFLEKQEPISELKYSKELSMAATDHAKDIGSKGLASHEGSEGKGINERVEKYIEWDGAIAENIDFCFMFAEHIVMNLIIDDGSKEKNQRMNLFNPEFKFAGVACWKHKTLKMCTVINYAKGVHPLGKESPNVVYNIQDHFDKYMIKDVTEAKNAFQVEDPYAPDNTVSVKIVKLKKVIDEVERNITRKIYLLDDGKQHIIEIEDKDVI